MTETVGPVAEAGLVYRPGYSRAAEQIMQYIDERGFGPGDRLPTEAQFAELLGISRSITRDALKTLAATGRITIQRGRGIYVADSTDFSEQVINAFIPTNIDHVMMLFEFRSIQERAAAELAADRATPAELVAIGNALADYSAAAESGDFAAATEADEAFHHAVAAASHNQLLAESIASAQSLQHRVVVIAFGGFSGGSLMNARDEHAAILDAIRNGDTEAAGRAAYAHLERTRLGYQVEIGRRVFPRHPH
ncbi:FadR/GntR family transcriptional regulator [Dactylosporangium sp. McL0621]|uniref:FadR/GntR family transcriptional regulator n=1 Tax=Dactylosporangium sp. McL0621 TaxID=3415678 RepID=UPI003CF130AA